jgi:putative transposase
MRMAGIEPLRLPVRSPNLNAYAERFVRTIREECLDRMIFFGETSLRRALQEFVTHYNHERNHQGLGNRILKPEVTVIPATGALQCLNGNVHPPRSVQIFEFALYNLGVVNS